MTYIIALPYVGAMGHTCIDEYPVDCVYEDEQTLYIHPDECVDCGACEPVCPVEAIYYEDDLSEKWSVSESVGTEFFDDTGSPSGTQRLGPTGSDYPYVAGLSPQGK